MNWIILIVDLVVLFCVLKSFTMIVDRLLEWKLDK